MNFFVNEAMGVGNSGVEHAQFYRAKRFKQANIPFKFVFTSLIDELHEAMAKWNLREDEVINMWEFFVFGKDYALNGIKDIDLDQKRESYLIKDYTETHRTRSVVLESGIRIERHMVKYPNPEKDGMLLVSTTRTEIFDEKTNERRIGFEMLPKYGIHKIQNIHLYNYNGKHQFFSNEVQLRRFFFHELEKIFGSDSVYIVDRGEENEVALIDDTDNAPRKIVEIIHADHLSDRDVPQDPLWNNFYEYALTHMEKVDRMVVATELQREDLLIDFPNYTKKIVTIPVGGVSDLIEENVAEKKHDHSLKDELKLVTISRLASEKHIDLIVKAVINLHNQGQNVSLDIFGAGGERKKLEDIIKDGNAENYVALNGLTHHANQEYPKYDAFVSASYSEGFGLTYIEALNAGLPIITFKARFGALEMVKEGYNGYLVDFKRDDDDFNIENLQQGIEKLINLEPISDKNIADSVEQFRDQVIADKWRTLIDEL